MSSVMNTTTKIKSYRRLPLYIVEDHNEVLPYIHRAIGSHHLPFSNLVFVHFDSHPDMLIPKDMPADEVFKKESLYENVSIENWIMPMIYAGHIDVILWVKPPWCTQIEDKSIHFYVGKCVSTGTLRCSCKESYFVSETLYRPESQLINKKKVQLIVFTLKPNGWKDDVLGKKESVLKQSIKHKADGQTNDSDSVQRTEENDKRTSVAFTGICKCEHNNVESKNTCCKCKRDKHGDQDSSRPCGSQLSPLSDLFRQSLKDITKLLNDFSDRTLVLDIDLDFYSTKNPFIEVYTPSQYRILQELYCFQAPCSDTEEDIEACVLNREKELSHLKQEFLKFMQTSEPNLTHPKADKIKALVQDLQRCRTDDDPVNFDLLHEAGCTCDDTELPHHVSSQEEITLLVDATQEFLSHIKRPTIITMARSSQDDYCPPEQVESIQNSVLEILQDLYLEIDLTIDYA
uniref:UPF0489 protein C5orf22 homolog n=1 Tax=Crassostrea virginica TaxID=6565 RepID=A0A8B8EUK8_CRAVI|nr:UPF0489 protein C5orf22 homolog [Crassostrea virginica]